MIGYLKGKILEKSPMGLILDCSGIGFFINLPLSTSAKLGDVGKEVALYIYPHFQESGMELYGFLTKEEKSMFLLLLSCPGVGPKAGLSVLSRMEIEEIKKAIKGRKTDVLKKVPGIGPKKAEMIVFKLRDKFKEVAEEAVVPEEAVEVLVSLGVSRKEAINKIKAIPDYGTLSTEEIVKLALKR